MNRLDEIRGKPERLVIGLSSGTSADGVDAALVRISGSPDQLSASILVHQVFPHPPDVRERILSAMDGRCDVSSLCRLNYELGEIFAKAAASLVESSASPIKDIDIIGSHGQTICHLPPAPGRGSPHAGSTMQLGESSVIAEQTGAAVVYDFRSADIAAGGQGAPLAPCLDYILFKDEKVSRAFLNLGGIANLTVLPAGCSWQEVIGFDTGPGNMILDHVAGKLFGVQCDLGGSLSRPGRPSHDLLEILLEGEFFSKPPPKSTGRESFGREYSEELLRLSGTMRLSREDVMATAAMLTALSVRRAYVDFVPPEPGLDELYVSGGGSANATVIERLGELFRPARLFKTEKLGIPVRAKEALLFAVLADCAVRGEPTSLPQVTGARRRVILGKIVP